MLIVAITLTSCAILAGIYLMKTVGQIEVSVQNYGKVTIFIIFCVGYRKK